MARYRLAAAFAVFAAVGVAVYLTFQPPADLQGMSESDERIARYGLWAAIAGAAASFFAMLKEALGLFRK